MAGFYIHIPFCRKLCYYCDFHFTVSLKHKESLIDALIIEIQRRNAEFSDVIFDTIYFGGGTPSVLNIDEIMKILNAIYKHFKIAENPEVTFESNPDDLTHEYLAELKKHTPVNRLSIGVQSFHDKDLQLMNRRHTAHEAVESIVRSRIAGFNNINVDLIYGIPGMTLELWQQNLDTFQVMNLEHLSAYHLTFEPKTVFSHYVKKGKMVSVDEDTSIKQFELLLDFTRKNGYDHYEISNFAREGFYSKHNMAYWTGKPYIGIGPSAHSFLNSTRRFNVSNNTKYSESLLEGKDNYFETEQLDERTSYNEFILISLRTKWGVNVCKLQSTYGNEYWTYFNQNSQQFIDDGTLILAGENIALSSKGMLITDYVISELMIVD